MTRILLHIIVFIIAISPYFLTSCHEETHNETLEPLYIALDAELSRSPYYQNRKENTINEIKARLRNESDISAIIHLTGELIAEYDGFNSDSTLFYINQNIELLESVGSNQGLHTNLLILKAQILSSSGFLKDALDLLENLDFKDLTKDSQIEYYRAFAQIYQQMIDYSDNEDINRKYRHLRDQFTDSLLEVLSPESEKYVLVKAPRLYGEGNPSEALSMLENFLEKHEPGDRIYSTIAYLIAFINHRMGDEKEYEKYLILSAISDTKGAIKENVSFSQLASINFEHGDIDRANLYIEKSFEDATFFSSRIRTLEAGQLLPLIDKAYIGRQVGFQHRLRGYVIAISLLAGALAISLYFISRQYLKIKTKNRQIESNINTVSELNKELSEKENALVSANNELEKSNRVKDEYLNTFMSFASESVATMSEYVLSLKKYVKTGDMDSLLKKIDSHKVSDAVMMEFIDLFDTAFLKLYPDFIVGINKLLKPEETLDLKPNEKLNPELRIIALMYLGITDPQTIAEFLHYSVATVYTYRSKLKKRAINPDTFEQDALSC